MGADDQVVVTWMDLDVAHRYPWQVEAQVVPAAAGIEAHEDALLHADVENVGVLRVFADDLGVIVLRQARRQIGAVGAVVVAAPDVRREVVETMLIDIDVSATGNVTRSVDLRHPGLCRKVWNVAVDQRPVAGASTAAVARHLHVAVVGADPDDAGFDGRLGHSEDGGVELRRGVVVVDLTARIEQLVGLGIRQVGADHLEAVVLVGAAK